ncbi:suppressor of fused domain protein [Paenibacillus agricola]|uniref:Suppressor of fused domain protein n=1 Tax=Paenibacillus agricola TaxID=2716264 RepID=A0ABX0J701_9BACL|nr:suppressor of fused domain protein [Paenibacillus agricola]NHN32129.1 suppressor of fused domain protein [Paenibacillus agricola]
MTEQTEAPGWDAIDQAFSGIYGKTEPKHYGTLIPYQLGGPDPLDGISAYPRSEPVPHWHFVTYGFSELYKKEGTNPDYSGYGFELTFRLQRDSSEEEPPAWAMNMLQNIARYVFKSGNYFQTGHYLDMSGPIALESDTLLRAIAFIDDPELQPIQTPNGEVVFLQVMGITVDEMEAIQAWNCIGLLKAAAPYLPLFVTDLSRSSIMGHAEVAAAWQAGKQRDGSSTGSLFVENFQWGAEEQGGTTSYTISLGARQAPVVGGVVNGRIRMGKQLLLFGQGISVTFRPDGKPHAGLEEEQLVLQLDEPTALELADKLFPKEGSFTLSTLPDVRFQITKSDIRDQDGNIVETIG